MARKILKSEIYEGFSPIYENGRITPETRGLGPEYEKDLPPMKYIPSEKPKAVPKPKVTPAPKQPKRKILDRRMYA
jgi:hypothetical protein